MSRRRNPPPPPEPAASNVAAALEALEAAVNRGQNAQAAVDEVIRRTTSRPRGWNRCAGPAPINMGNRDSEFAHPAAGGIIIGPPCKWGVKGRPALTRDLQCPRCRPVLEELEETPPDATSEAQAEPSADAPPPEAAAPQFDSSSGGRYGIVGVQDHACDYPYGEGKCRGRCKAALAIHGRWWETVRK